MAELKELEGITTAEIAAIFCDPSYTTVLLKNGRRFIQVSIGHRSSAMEWTEMPPVPGTEAARTFHAAERAR